jgi:hypothetical protein
VDLHGDRNKHTRKTAATKSDDSAAPKRVRLVKFNLAHNQTHEVKRWISKQDVHKKKKTDRVDGTVKESKQSITERLLRIPRPKVGSLT